MTAGVNAYQVKPVSYAEHLTLMVELFGYWCARSAPAGYRGADE